MSRQVWNTSLDITFTKKKTCVWKVTDLWPPNSNQVINESKVNCAKCNEMSNRLSWPWPWTSRQQNQLILESKWMFVQHLKTFPEADLNTSHSIKHKHTLWGHHILDLWQPKSNPSVKAKCEPQNTRSLRHKQCCSQVYHSLNVKKHNMPTYCWCCVIQVSVSHDTQIRLKMASFTPCFKP